ncbi:MAG: hypothetical protein K2P04_05950 [Oscillospiraceae bacterium]|jgi:hypothetical protein|nr:hypothetical protein [Oscillospiraceae bacterium]MDE6997399.1 hypothetical protein [Oscillospiraceae bacterium]
MEHEELLEIARIISDGDEAVLKEMSGCLTDTEAFYEARRERYEERCVDAGDDPLKIRLLGLVDILEEHGYVCERDWKDEKEDFFYFFSSLHGIKRLKLDMQEAWLDEDGDIEEWCGILNEKWTDRQCCAAAVGIDSDSYVLFTCTLEELARLEKLAPAEYPIEKVGRYE